MITLECVINYSVIKILDPEILFSKCGNFFSQCGLNVVLLYFFLLSHICYKKKTKDSQKLLVYKIPCLKYQSDESPNKKEDRWYTSVFSKSLKRSPACLTQLRLVPHVNCSWYQQLETKAGLMLNIHGGCMRKVSYLHSWSITSESRHSSWGCFSTSHR